jgi:hypothetical protein
LIIPPSLANQANLNFQYYISSVAGIATCCPVLKICKMKTLKRVIPIIITFVLFQSANAQSDKTQRTIGIVTQTIKVSGTCSMDKRRIETAAISVEGVKSAAVTVTILAACNNSGPNETKDTAEKKSTADNSKMMSAVKYTCTMHPEVVSDTAGHCPKCGMALIPLDDSSAKKMNMDTIKH